MSLCSANLQITSAVTLHHLYLLMSVPNIHLNTFTVNWHYN